ncbi:MAG: hypothetical protein EOM87_07500 [Clostridia bacterium]|nr:hypothetical protein [Clostridia bacterium]
MRYNFIRRFRSNKGLTLVELIVAMAVTFILMASLSSLLVPITSLYRNSESKIIMENVGQKLLRDLAGRSAACTNLVLYDNPDPTVPNNIDYKIYLSGGIIYQRFRTGDNICTLTSVNSYQGCTVTALDFFAEIINEKKSFEDPTLNNRVRILYVRIKLSKNNVESDYMLTTVKIYNFSTTGDEIKDSTGSLARTNRNPRTAETGYKSLLITPYF